MNSRALLSLSRSKIIKTAQAIFIIISLIVNCGSFYFNVPFQASAADDWLAGWQDRSEVLVESNDVSLTNQQTKILLQGNDPMASNYIDFNKVASGGGDIRLTDSDGITPIPYWIESWDDNSKTATVWTKIPTVAKTPTPPYFKFSVPKTLHENYGLAYPVTYEFDIPSNSSGLKALRSSSDSGEWSEISEKTPEDFFNGVEAVRFDYANNKAYLSAAFAADSGNLYLKIINNQNQQVGIFETITKFYDNRRAAVIVSGDDWYELNNESFGSACDMLASKALWFSPGIVTVSGGVPMSAGGWSYIQSKINAGYVEPASHSRTHPLSVPYANVASEVQGSKDDIINNLDLPALNKKGDKEYLYIWIEPAGLVDTSIRNQLGQSKYLADRDLSLIHEFSG